MLKRLKKGWGTKCAAVFYFSFWFLEDTVWSLISRPLELPRCGCSDEWAVLELVSGQPSDWFRTNQSIVGTISDEGLTSVENPITEVSFRRTATVSVCSWGWSQLCCSFLLAPDRHLCLACPVCLEFPIRHRASALKRWISHICLHNSLLCIYLIC